MATLTMIELPKDCDGAETVCEVLEVSVGLTERPRSKVCGGGGERELLPDEVEHDLGTEDVPLCVGVELEKFGGPISKRICIRMLLEWEGCGAGVVVVPLTKFSSF